MAQVCLVLLKLIKMSAFTNLIANLFSGFLPSVISMFTGLDNKGWTPDGGAQHVAEDLASLQDQNLISNYFRKTSGASLTDAEREANEWSRQQTLDAWSRQMEADNTKYQRQVLDMQAAGLNPMLAAGSSVHVPQAAVASSISPSSAVFNIGDLVSLLSMRSNIGRVQAASDLDKAKAKEAEENANKLAIENRYRDEFQRLLLEGQEKSNNLTDTQISYLYDRKSEILQHVENMRKEAKTEDAKFDLYCADAILKRASAEQITELLPYEKSYREAASQELKERAALQAAQAMYQLGLLDNGYISYIVSKAASEAGIAASENDIKQIQAAIRTGSPHGIEGGARRKLLGMVVSVLDALKGTFIR